LHLRDDAGDVIELLCALDLRMRHEDLLEERRPGAWQPNDKNRISIRHAGAGSAILMMLMILYRTSPAATVGTDVVLGVLLAGVTGFLQFKLLENVDLLLVASVLAGSIPTKYSRVRGASDSVDSSCLAHIFENDGVNCSLLMFRHSQALIRLT